MTRFTGLHLSDASALKSPTTLTIVIGVGLMRMTTSEAGPEIQVDKETIQQIKDRVFVVEEEQRHLDKPHNILPQIRDIVREEVDQ